jgi:hypothetical protein
MLRDRIGREIGAGDEKGEACDVSFRFSHWL